MQALNSSSKRGALTKKRSLSAAIKALLPWLRGVDPPQRCILARLAGFLRRVGFCNAAKTQALLGKAEGITMIHGTDDGNTLLHFASRVGNILLIRKLLQQGEDINVKNRSGQTALDIAKQYQQKEVVLELSRHGAQG